jgi:HTH-type transcriptional regulator, competence development regulator
MGPTLGQLLKEARRELGLTLREIERTSGISNGYLSLLESDKVKQPSPKHLAELSRALVVPYADLMRAAGYLLPESSNQAVSSPDSIATASRFSDLSVDEWRQVDAFVRGLKAGRPKN